MPDQPDSAEPPVRLGLDDQPQPHPPAPAPPRSRFDAFRARMETNDAQREARAREFRAGLMPWAQRVPGSILMPSPWILTAAGFLLAIAGMPAWVMAGPAAAAVLQVAANAPRMRCMAPAGARAWTAALSIVVGGIGVVLVHAGTVWLTVPGWLVVTMSVWNTGANLAVFITLLISPPTE